MSKPVLSSTLLGLIMAFSAPTALAPTAFGQTEDIASAEESVATPHLGPAKPENFKINRMDWYDGYHHTVDLSWNIDSDSDISGYEFRVKEGDKDFSDWESLSINDLRTIASEYTTNYLLDHHLLLPNQNYTFQLRAITSTLEGQVSEGSVTFPYREPHNPSPVTAKLLGKDVKLSWLDSTNGVAQYSYDYRVRKEEEGFDKWTWRRIENSFHDGTTNRKIGPSNLTLLTHSAMIKDLDPGATYIFQVRAVSGSLVSVFPPSSYSPFFGMSSPSAIIKIPHQPPAAPEGFKATLGSNDLVTLSWENPSNSSITGYEYRMSIGRNGNFDSWQDWTAIAGSSASTTSYTVKGERIIAAPNSLNLFEDGNQFQVRAVINNLKGQESPRWVCWLAASASTNSSEPKSSPFGICQERIDDLLVN